MKLGAEDFSLCLCECLTALMTTSCTTVFTENHWDHVQHS